jgi:hypothetical protein
MMKIFMDVQYSTPVDDHHVVLLLAKQELHYLTLSGTTFAIRLHNPKNQSV